MLCRFFCNIRLLWFPGKKSCIIKVKDKELKIHRYWLPGRLLCSIRSNRKWCKRRGSSLECQNCFFVYPIIDSNLTNLSLRFLFVYLTNWKLLTQNIQIRNHLQVLQFHILKVLLISFLMLNTIFPKCHQA